LDKKQHTESDIRARFITSAIERAGWDAMTQVLHEFGLRAGRISVRGKTAHRDKTTILKADNALFSKPNIPIALVEAKDNTKPMGSGMAQAIHFAQLLDAPFSVYINGDGFVYREPMSSIDFKQGFLATVTKSKKPIISKVKCDLLLLPLPPQKKQELISDCVKVLCSIFANVRTSLRTGECVAQKETIGLTTQG